jgi:POT family proton-dependent oligopeptide transporter
MFALLWPRMAARGREPSTPVKMGAGLLLLAAGYVFMLFAGGQADRGILVSPWWLVAMYVLHTWGELCLSPVGLSLVTRLAPVQLASLLMGVWFLANFTGNWVAGQASALMDTFPSLRAFFAMFVVTSAVAGLVLLAISPFMRRLMHGRG